MTDTDALNELSEQQIEELEASNTSALISVVFGSLHNINARASGIKRWIKDPNYDAVESARAIIHHREEAHVALVKISDNLSLLLSMARRTRDAEKERDYLLLLLDLHLANARGDEELAAHLCDSQVAEEACGFDAITMQRVKKFSADLYALTETNRENETLLADNARLTEEIERLKNAIRNTAMLGRMIRASNNAGETVKKHAASIGRLAEEAVPDTKGSILRSEHCGPIAPQKCKGCTVMETSDRPIYVINPECPVHGGEGK